MNSLPGSLIFSLGGSLLVTACMSKEKKEIKHPNILIAISDDQSFTHTSFAGCRFVSTPGFDRVARNGIYFTSCWSGSPGSAPSRSSLVTGRYHWQNEQSGQHASSWMKKYVPFVDALEGNGYHTGFTGKGVGPFQYARDEKDSLWRKENAAGKSFNSIQYGKKKHPDDRTAKGIGAIDYFANFRDFMKSRKDGTPFCFWYGATEPHREYERDSWKRNNKDTADVDVPGFMPASPEIKGDILDYAVEIEWFDRHLVRMLNYLDSIGELDNTIVIVTGDNGMPFPRAKANFYEYGIHVPLAIMYPGFPGKRIVEDPVSFTDFAPTILELTNTSPGGMMPISGRSIVNILKSDRSGVVDVTKKYIFAGRERHSSSRWNNLGYPVRAVRTTDFMLVWNMLPDLWPAGDPQSYKDGTRELAPMFGIDENGKHVSEWAFTDVDASPSKSYMIEHHTEAPVRELFELSFGKRPEFELYNVKSDPYGFNNLIGNPEFTAIEQELKAVLIDELRKSGDPRVVGPVKDIFETYERFSPIREFPEHKRTKSVPVSDAFFKSALDGLSGEIDKFLAAGTDVNSKDSDGRTALMYASFNGHTAIMSKLIQKGAVVSTTDPNGRTALMLAASGSFPAAVKLLLDSNADPNLIDKEEHFTALMYAAAEGQLENVRLLLKYKADPLLKDVDGDNALTFAKNNNHKDVVEYLSGFVK